MKGILRHPVASSAGAPAFWHDVAMTQDPAEKAADPNTPHAELYELARSRPDLRAQIAANPNTYPALLQWLRELGDPAVSAALRERETAGASTDEFGALRQHSYRDEPTAVQPPVAPRRDFDQQVYGSPAPYAALPQQQRPVPVYDPEEVVAPRKAAAGGVCVLFALLFLVTATALAVAYFFLMGNPFTDDEPEPEATPSPTEEAPEPDDAETEDSATPSEEDHGADTADLLRPAPEDALSMTEFSSPTGNINCQLTDESLACTVIDFEFEAPEGCTDGVTVRVEADGSPEFDCSAAVGSQGQSLDYGEVTGNDEFVCQAHEMYFDCWSQVTGNGFEIAREYYDLYAG